MESTVKFISCLLFISNLSSVLCDFTYGYETDDFTLAIINLTYTDPNTGVQHTEYEEYGKYSIGRIGSVSGRLIHVSSNQKTRHDACEPIDVEVFPSEPWIALAQYGNCRDSVKLKNIANTNASAAVIYNNKAGTRLIKMHQKEATSKSYYEYQEVSVSGLEIWHFASNLISVFISKEKGEALAAMVDNGTRVMVQISIGTTSAMRYANINRTSVLFVSISFIVLMIISLAWLIFYYVQRFRYIHAKDILARRLNSAAKKAMDKIPTKTIRPSDLESIFDGEFAELCPVCIDTFKTCDIVRILPCKSKSRLMNLPPTTGLLAVSSTSIYVSMPHYYSRHLFHKSCVDPWLLENRSCPMCKMDILKYYGLVFAGSQESILNIDVDLDLNQHYWHRGRHRNSSGDEIEVVHIPISSPMARNNRRRQRRNHPNSNTNSCGHSQSHSSSSDSSSPNSVTEPLKESNTNEESAPVVVIIQDSTQLETNQINDKSIEARISTDSVTQTGDNFNDTLVDDDCQPLSSEGDPLNNIQITSNDNQNNCRTEQNISYDRLCSEQKY